MSDAPDPPGDDADAPPSEPQPDDPPTAYERLLVAEAAGVVKTEANRVARSFSRVVHPNGLFTLGDLLAIGHAALYGAARAYEKDKNPQFSAYARYYVRGALLDALDDLLFEERLKVAVARATDNLLAYHRGDDYDVMKHDEGEARRRYRAFAKGLAAATFAAAMEEAGKHQDEDEVGELRDYALGLALVRSALGRLPEADRRLMELVYRDLLQLKQASAKLGIPYGTARARHGRALTVLYELLIAEGIARAPRPAVVPLVDVFDDTAPGAQNDTGEGGAG